MKIQSVELTKFKRFTHLIVDNIPETARLVIMAGPNGSGKSSFFEGLYSWYRSTWSRLGHNWDDAYHIKQIDDGEEVPAGARRVAGRRAINDSIKIQFYDPQPATDEERRAAVYVRSAYRNDPAFQIDQLQRMGEVVAENRFNRFIENDATVRTNYQRLASQGMSAIYRTEDPSTTIGEFRQKTIGDIQRSMRRLFPALILNDLGDPLDQGTFYFDKGTSKNFPYQNLSGGEKAAFDLMLDIIVKRGIFRDSIYCIDEPEAHMNTRLQGALLQELYELIPEKCQLWLATHSIGMMRRARDLSKQYPGEITFLDFGDKDFDKEVHLRPEIPDRAFWHRVLNVALDDVAELVAPEIIVVCEGKPRVPGAGKNAAMDAHCYDKIFETEFPHAKFISAGNAHEVETDRIALVEAMRGLVKGAEIIRLIDRDDRSPEEVAEAAAKGIRVLTRRHLESYLFDDEVLSALCDSLGKSDKWPELQAAKAQAIEGSNRGGNAPDDIKSASGPIYVQAKQILEIVGGGNNAKAFMRATLAPFLRPGLETYKTLRDDIFGGRYCRSVGRSGV
jgi:ABC-type cobalamin/Fe3+-siderophores transport system ATPase subunit